MALMLSLMLVLGLVLTGCSDDDSSSGSSSSGKKLKVGFLYLGEIGDAGYTYAHDQGRKMVEKELGDKVETVYKVNVKEDKADVEKACEEMCF